MEEEFQADNKFNSSITTLNRINNLLSEMKNMAIAGVEGSVPRGKAQHIRYEQLYQLFLTVIPLIDEEVAKNVEEKYNTIKLEFQEEIDKVGRRKKIVEVFSPETEKIIREVQKELSIELTSYLMQFADDEGD